MTRKREVSERNSSRLGSHQESTHAAGNRLRFGSIPTRLPSGKDKPWTEAFSKSRVLQKADEELDRLYQQIGRLQVERSGLKKSREFR